MSYRRNDSQGEAGRLFDDLTGHFGDHAVFMDVSAIEPGRDFRKAIEENVASCGVLLAVIGQDWLESKDGGGRLRLDDQNDFVRIELASALRRDIPVVPVLVRGARMPAADRLPADLSELAYRNAVELTHARWRSDVQLLMQALKPHLGTVAPAAPLPDLPSHGKATEVRRQPDLPANRVHPIADGAAHASIAPALLERVTEDLAAYVGPIAELIVQRAARRCSTVEDLYRIAAPEIEDDTQRAKFLTARRT